MRIIWKQWGQQRFSYWLNNKMNLSTDNNNIKSCHWVLISLCFCLFFFFWQVLELAADVLKRVPEEIDYEQTAKIMSDDPSPLNVVLLQEVSDIIYAKWYARKILQLSSSFTCTQSTKLKLPDDWHRPELGTSIKIHSFQFMKFFKTYANMLLWPVGLFRPLAGICPGLHPVEMRTPYDKHHKVSSFQKTRQNTKLYENDTRWCFSSRENEVPHCLLFS